MKLQVLLIVFIFLSENVFSQLELTTGYAVNKNLADGLPIQISYDLKINDRLFTKSQIGYKYLNHFNDFVGATLKVHIIELHQTLSYEIIKKKNYILKPNVGLNYRLYKWKAKMKAPLNSLPIRAWTIGTRDGNFVITSTDGEDYREYSPTNFGFSFQLQNQFRINNKLWLHITPFIEPDYDMSQNTGGCYFGVIIK